MTDFFKTCGYEFRWLHAMFTGLIPFVPNAPFLHPFFQGAEKGCIGNKQVNCASTTKKQYKCKGKLYFTEAQSFHNHQNFPLRVPKFAA